MTNSTNPFNPAALRLSQSFADTVGVKKLLTTVPVRKPGRQDFVRVHPDPAYRLTPAAVIELKEDRETYLVRPDIAQQLPGEFNVVTLHTTINRQGVLHLWPVKHPGPDGKHNEWHRSAAEAMGSLLQASIGGDLGYLRARGFVGDPTAPVTGSGGATNMNS